MQSKAAGADFEGKDRRQRWAGIRQFHASNSQFLSFPVTIKRI